MRAARGRTARASVRRQVLFKLWSAILPGEKASREFQRSRTGRRLAPRQRFFGARFSVPKFFIGGQRRITREFDRHVRSISKHTCRDETKEKIFGRRFGRCPPPSRPEREHTTARERAFLSSRSFVPFGTLSRCVRVSSGIRFHGAHLVPTGHETSAFPADAPVPPIVLGLKAITAALPVMAAISLSSAALKPSVASLRGRRTVRRARAVATRYVHACRRESSESRASHGSRSPRVAARPGDIS